MGRGWLNETTSVVAAVREWWALESFWKSKLQTRDNG
jgi:hypothetical protein